MPTNREPALYQGSVISMIGVNAGAEIVMDYKTAQGCVANGTARWIDDETDLPNHIKARVAERTAEEDAKAESDRLAMEAKANRGATNVAQLLAERADKICVGIYTDGDGKQVEYLMRPFPAVVAFTRDLMDAEPEMISVIFDEAGEGVDTSKNGDIIVKLSNGIARYRPIPEAETDDQIVAQLQEDDVVQPEVDIPADWQKMSHLQLIPMAKNIRGTTASMKKAEAIAIIEEWTKTDDQVSIDPADNASGEGGTQTEGQGKSQAPNPEQGNRDQREFDPAAAADKAAADLAHDKEND